MQSPGRDDGGPVWFQHRPGGDLARLATSIHGYRIDLAGGVEHLAVPAPSLPLILSVGPDHAIRAPGSEEVVRVDAFLAGLSARPVLVGADQFAGIQVDLTPVGAHRLVGHGLAELVDRSVGVGDVLGRDALELREQLVEQSDWSQRTRSVRDFLHRRLQDGAPPRPELAWTWDRLVATGGQVRIAALADELGWSPRHLRRRFRAAFGLTPKAAARVVRFDRVARILTGPSATAVDLSRLAHDAGYVDQAHMANEVREMAGLTPTALVAASAGGNGVYVADDAARPRSDSSKTTIGAAT